MPKINVYLPDDLAEAVKEASVPVSAICQAALEQAVRRLTTIRQLVASDLDSDTLESRLPRFTEKARTAFKLAAEQARAAGVPLVGTEHLLGGLLAEGSNLALPVLHAMDIETSAVKAELDRAAVASHPAGPDAGRRISGPLGTALSARRRGEHARAQLHRLRAPAARADLRAGRRRRKYCAASASTSGRRGGRSPPRWPGSSTAGTGARPGPGRRGLWQRACRRGPRPRRWPKPSSGNSSRSRTGWPASSGAYPRHPLGSADDAGARSSAQSACCRRRRNPRVPLSVQEPCDHLCGRAGPDAPRGHLRGHGDGLRRYAHDDGTGDGGVADGGLAHAAGACRRRSGGHPEGVRRAPGRAAVGEGAGCPQVPSATLVSTTLVDDVSFWRAPGQPQAILAWEQAHLPRDFTPEDADFGPPSWDRTFSLTPIPGVLNARDLVVEVVAAGNGQTAIRVDAQVSWQPSRPAFPNGCHPPPAW